MSDFLILCFVFFFGGGDFLSTINIKLWYIKSINRHVLELYKTMTRIFKDTLGKIYNTNLKEILSNIVITNEVWPHVKIIVPICYSHFRQKS